MPWYLGVRALYYRTDVFSELGLKPPATLAELTTTARAIRAARPELFGVAVGGKYTYGAMPFVWAHGGDLTSIDSAQSRAGLKAYTDLIAEDNCPPQNCADLTGGKTVELFAGGKAAIGAGTRFVPLDPGWGKIDASAVLPTMIEKVATGKAGVDEATTEAAELIDEALTR